MDFRKDLPEGRVLRASMPLVPPPGPPEVVLAAAQALDWALIEDGQTLHLHLADGVALPPGLGGSSLVWELARSLAGPLDVSIAVATGPAVDIAAVVAALGAPAMAEAVSLARMPIPTLDDGPAAIWDRLSHAARRAQALGKEGRLQAAALAFRGRGRLVGPITGDLLIRFGVSAWR